jgi:hypothetical protein
MRSINNGVRIMTVAENTSRTSARPKGTLVLGLELAGAVAAVSLVVWLSFPNTCYGIVQYVWSSVGF